MDFSPLLTVLFVGAVIALILYLIKMAPLAPGTKSSDDISAKIAAQKREQEAKDNFYALLALGFFLVIVAVVVLAALFLWNGITGSGVFYHTERVMADVGSHWIEQEQKKCLYERHPGEDTAYLLCETGNGLHNIPVKFSGMAPGEEELKKPIRQEWKCERQGEAFSCRDGKPVPVN